MNVIEKKIPEIYKDDIDAAVEILSNAGCTSIYVFGSIANGSQHKNSDIDFAVTGLKPGMFYRVAAQLNMGLNHNFDLVKLDDEKNTFAEFISDNEKFIRVS